MNLLAQDELVFEADTHTYSLRGKEAGSVTSYIKEILGDPFANVPQDRLEFCRARGNAVHKAAQLLIEGKLDWNTVDPRIEGYVRAVERFHKECPGDIVYAEKPLISLGANLAGRPDIVKFVRARRSVIDYKTSAQQTNRMRLQTAGYKRLHNTLFQTEPILDRYGLRLQPDGFYKLIPHTDLDDDLAFEDIQRAAKAMRAAERWTQKYAK